MVVNFRRDQIFMDFIRFLIDDNYEVLYTWSLRYNIFSAKFLDIRISTCFNNNFFNNFLKCYSNFFLADYEPSCYLEVVKHRNLWSPETLHVTGCLKSPNAINKCKLLELGKEHNVHLVNVYPVQNLCDHIIREYFAAIYTLKFLYW